MTITYDWPSTPEFFVREVQGPYVERNGFESTSLYSGNYQATDTPGARFRMTATLPQCPRQYGGRRGAYFNKVGRSNWIRAWNFERPAPAGTMRGNPVLVGNTGQGSTQIIVGTMAGATLTMGDMLGLGGLWLQAADDTVANSSGVMTVNLVTPLRFTVAGGTGVIWNRPTATFRVDSGQVPILSMPGLSDTVQVGLIEVW